MKLIKVENQAEAGKVAFNLFKESINAGLKTVGLATGSTPITFYKEIVASDLDLSNFTSVNLDEYVGLEKSSNQSYDYFMKSHLFDAKPFKENFLPNGMASDLVAETKHYDEVIAAHPIDFFILGIGRNGHIGFNEPGTSFDMTTHVVDLTESTIEANARFFANEDEVPRQAISMGIASIMQAKEIVLLAFGAEKAEAIKGMIEDPVTEQLPGSILQKHPNVTVIVDPEAASKLA